MGLPLMTNLFRSGNSDIWIKDLENGKETALTVTPSDEQFPSISPDGSKVAYGIVENQRAVMYVMPVVGGAAEKVCVDCPVPRS
jgi:Tol biopolymer transport system component